jgi:dihydropteroate synthase
MTLARGGHLTLSSRPLVMGILNITPDSFSDGGLWFEASKAVEHGLRMVEEGADILDLGAESTRPGGGTVYGDGARELSIEEEIARLLPVLTGLRKATDVPLSVDTRKGAVAQASLEAGADLINDVGGLEDSELRKAVAAAGCPVVVMHSRGNLASMQRDIHFENTTAEVVAELQQCRELAHLSGIHDEQLIFDPGIGFGKDWRQNLELLRGIDGLQDLGRPLLIGASRKSFIHQISPAEPQNRLGGSLAAVAWAARLGVSFVRVHDVAQTAQFLRVWNAIHLADRLSLEDSN